MIRRFTALSLLGAVALAGCSDAPIAGPDAGAPSLSAAPAGASRHLVLLKGNGIAADFATRVAAAGGKLERSHQGAGFAVVSGLTPEGAAALAAGRDVAQVEPDMEFTVDALAGSAEVMDVSPASPSNPATAFFYPRQWHLRAIGAQHAWAAGRLGSPSVTVAILDSGIDPTVPDLVGRVDVSRSTSFVPDDSFDELVRSIVFPSAPKYTDLHFHGTHVAATVSSNALVAAGVTSNVTLMAVKVLGLIPSGNASGSLASVLSGVLYAADNGADVANMSLGGTFAKAGNGRYIGLIQRSFNYANAKGMTVVVSAGNEETDLDHDGNLYKTYCSAPNVICVSATGPTNASLTGPWDNVDALAWYSNYGRSAINVAAPGGSESYVTAACSRTSYLYQVCGTGNYVLGSAGTSMAAPHVSGLAALVVEDVGRTPSQVRAKLQQTADDLGQPGTDPYYGKGRINVKTALGL